MVDDTAAWNMRLDDGRTRSDEPSSVHDRHVQQIHLSGTVEVKYTHKSHESCVECVRESSGNVEFAAWCFFVSLFLMISSWLRPKAVELLDSE